MVPDGSATHNIQLTWPNGNQLGNSLSQINVIHISPKFMIHQTWSFSSMFMDPLHHANSSWKQASPYPIIVHLPVVDLLNFHGANMSLIKVLRVMVLTSFLLVIQGNLSCTCFLASLKTLILAVRLMLTGRCFRWANAFSCLRPVSFIWQ